MSYVLRAGAEDWLQDGASGRKTVLVAEASPFVRGVIRSGLDMAGYRVKEAASVEEAIRGLEAERPDLVMAACDLPQGGEAALLTAMRNRPDWTGLPMLSLASSAAQMLQKPDDDGLERQMKFDRTAMLESVARLASALTPEAGIR